MEDTVTKSPSVKVLKQMSITRQDLEKSSEKLVDSLTRLQQDNVKQMKSIDETLSEVQKEQTAAEQLLHCDWMNQSDDHSSKSADGVPLKKPLRREPTIVRQLRQWTTSDVIRWLEKEGLHKFILTFQRHHVKGEDLAEIRLPFLDNYDHISVGDKELLLSHVYELLRLEFEEQEVMDFMSPVEREKYIAAKQISKDEQYKGRISPVIFLPSHNSTPSTSPSSVISSPIPKLRKCSEPYIPTDLPTGFRQRKVQTLDKPARKKKQVASNCTLFELLGGQQRQEVKCVYVQRHEGQFGLTLQTDSTGTLVIIKTNDNLASLLGSRVLEINGYIQSQLTDDKVLNAVMNDSHELYIVLAHDQGNNTEADRWETLRNVLSSLRDKDVDPDDLINISEDELVELKDKYTLQEELIKARDEIDDLKHQVAELSEQLSLQTKMMGEMKEQRDNAVRTKIKARLNRNDAGETEYYKMTMESLNVETATKEEVTESLKEIVKEASRQKFYLDRLISVVIEESPWLLDQVDAHFDDNSLVSNNEEFC